MTNKVTFVLCLLYRVVRLSM